MMREFRRESGVMAPMPGANIDTDVIMPKKFLKGVDRDGLAIGCFHEIRFDATGAERPDFILNRAGWRDAICLVVGPNFGCGSSREHAVWGLLQLGIRALIGSSFGGIFADNCANNGLLTISLETEPLAALLALAQDPARNRLTIDLPAQRIEAEDRQIGFAISEGRKQALLLGLDAVGVTLQGRQSIIDFERNYRKEHPWLV